VKGATFQRINMALFKHPSLVRGTVHTPHGAFVVVRRLVDIADEIGESLGWEPVERSAAEPAARERVPARRSSMNQVDAN
jgi:hypothetical protein